ncbi:MAG: hypothetical protein A3H97_01575 [Acidobacteria bacterium RIFCSPLOWO2_02_FULL_65_29]|nr:MAG: hypothetical protein A3H97_01575 [Acidobacteria bacterium RIFCSPLOWO2_02_FULL_65_29]
MGSAHRRSFLMACGLSLVAVGARGLAREPPASGAFAGDVARLSEPSGAFDADNLISNERSYLEVAPALAGRPIEGGAYIGVGPDQNFSYIARVRPRAAYIIDIRRDNLLLHLLFKALFAEARTRAEYLCLLTGRPVPYGTERWRAAGVDQLVAHVDQSTPWPDGPDAVDALRRRLDHTIAGFGVPLSRADLDTIARMHHTFIAEGLDLVFSSRGPAERRYFPASGYPTLRELLTTRAVDGRQWSYLASEDDFQFVKALQARDAVIPVVGDVSGTHALVAIGAAIAARGERVSAFYISNVEAYLESDSAVSRFIDNLSRLPRDEASVMIRSVFNGGSSTSLVEAIDQTLAKASRRGR